MVDNRNGGIDSRHHGQVPKGNIIGKVIDIKKP